MSHLTTGHTLPTPIALGAPLHRRLVQVLSDALDRLALWRQQQAEQRAARRQAALHRALVNQLDAATLRDLGLGDWVAARGAGRIADWSNVEPYRF
jgi:hypothetical protein